MNVMLGASWQQRAAESVEATSQNFSDDFTNGIIWEREQ